MTIPEKDYTRTPHIALGVIAKLPAAPGRIYAVLLRFTYGWHKNNAEISIATFHRLTGMSVNSVKKGLRYLIKLGVVKRLNPLSIKNAQWEIRDPSKIDPSFFDPSFIDGMPNKNLSKFDGSKRKNPSNNDPQSPRFKDKSKYIPVKGSASTATATGKKVISFFEQEIGKASPSIKEEILKAISTYTSEWVIEAIRKTMRLAPVPTWSYVSAVLLGWKTDGAMNKGAKNDNSKNKSGNAKTQIKNISSSTSDATEAAAKRVAEKLRFNV